MFRLNPFIRAGLSASVVSLAFPALADVNEETLVVTASATEQNVKDAPASISVITQQDLQRKPVQNLKDVLRDVPGVQLTNEGDNRKGVRESANKQVISSQADSLIKISRIWA
ncbi:TonB-dependent receptor plug domain-containing protein, partial [Klebsiella pneumoniae]|nr:TonB-dependent receptor plug domain-containing protein [Klebsiella pneumoniae]